jgi:hypothetical protein
VSARGALDRVKCVCGQLAPVTKARRVRAHSTVPGGRERCRASGLDVGADAAVIRKVPATEVVYRPRSEAALGRWCGPRTWEDAGI